MRANSKVKAVLWGALLWVSGGMASPALPQPPISATAGKASSYGSDQQLVYKEVDGRSLQLFIYKPKGWAASDKRRVVVYFHGGGWIGGTPGAVTLHLESWRAKEMVVISVQYRLATREKLDPACCIEDAKSAMRYIRGHAAELGIDPKRITVCGNSAGGHLAAACALLETFDCPSDDLTISCRPDAMMLLVPVLDNGPEKGYEGRNKFIQANVKAYSPAHNVAPDAPPTIIFGGAKDLFADLSRLRKFAENMKAAGNDCELYAYEGAHGFVYHSPDKEDIEEKMSAFLDRWASRVRLPGEPRRVGSNPQQTNNDGRVRLMCK